MARIIFFLLFLYGHEALTQNFLSWKYNDRYYSLALGTGMATYFGELNADNAINERVRMINLGLEARLLSRFSARVEGAYFQLEGSDRDAPEGSFEQQRNLNFQSNNLEGNLQVLFYFRKYNDDYFSRWNIDPYLAAGIGFAYYFPSTELGNETYFLRPLATEPNKDYALSTLIFPLSAGVKFKVNEFMSFNLEAGYRFTTTDYLDDVSTTIPETFENFTIEALSVRRDEIPLVNQDAYDALIPGGQRGNPNDNDGYLLIAFKVELYLPPGLFKSKGPAFKKPSAF